MLHGRKLPQSTENKKRKQEFEIDNDFIIKVASIVKDQLQPPITNPSSTVWRNFDLSPPSTSQIVPENTTPALHFNAELKKDDLNDSFGINIYLYLNSKMML